MPCERIEFPNGVGAAIVCTRGTARGKACRFCGRKASLLCDAPEPSSKTNTCDAPICSDCAVHDGPNLDFCPEHVAPAGFVARDVADWAEFVRERCAIAIVLGGLSPMAAMDQARRLAGPRPRPAPSQASRRAAPTTSVEPPHTLQRSEQLELAGTASWRSA